MIILLISLLLIVILFYFKRNNNLMNSISRLESFQSDIIENFDFKNKQNLIENGDFKNGKHIKNFTHSNGINKIIKKNNPGNTNYVLEQIKSDNKTYYEIQTNASRNQTYNFKFWVCFEDLESTKDFRNLIKINLFTNDRILKIKNLKYYIEKKLSLQNNSSPWYLMNYSFQTPNQYVNKMNLYLNYTKNLQAQKIYFADVKLYKVLKDAQKFNVLNGLKVFLNANNSSYNKKWDDISNFNNSFTWDSRPIANTEYGFIETINNKLKTGNANTILNKVENDGFSVVLVFSSNDSFKDGRNNKKKSNKLFNVLSLPGNNKDSINLYMSNGYGKLKVVFDNKGEYTQYSRPLTYYNKTVIVLTYKNKLINVYQDSIRVIKNMKVENIYLSNKDIVINKNKKWNGRLYSVLFYNQELEYKNIKNISNYFMNNENKGTVQNNYENSGVDIYNYDNSFEDDIDNINISSKGVKNGKKCKTKCRSMCRKFIDSEQLGSSLESYNRCINSCTNTIESCKTFCDDNPDDKFCRQNNEKCKDKNEDCPIAYKRNGHYKIYIPPNTKYEEKMGYSGEKSYGRNRKNAKHIYEMNFPDCDVPKELLPGSGKKYYEKCPFIVKNNNPCYSDYCGDVNWDKKGGYHIGMNKKCKHIVSNYCELYSDIDDSCLCWRKEYRNLPSCRKFRRKYQDPKDYQCNIKDFDIEEHPSFNKYIKKDKIPCWNCNIPN